MVITPSPHSSERAKWSGNLRVGSSASAYEGWPNLDVPSINTLEVLSEAIEQTTKRLSVEEAERGAKDRTQEDAVETITRAERSDVEYEPAVPVTSQCGDGTSRNGSTNH